MADLRCMYRGIYKVYKCLAAVLGILLFVNIINMILKFNVISLHHKLNSLETMNTRSLKYSPRNIIVGTDQRSVLAKNDQATSRKIHKKIEIKQEKTDRIVNPHPFRYLLNPIKFCSDDIFIITYVHSSPDHFYLRETIRKTWGSEQYVLNKHIKVVFILGKVPNKSVMTSVRYESDHFGDIVQEDFDDSYRNLTYKAIAGLKWVSTFCKQAKYVLKTDDDIFVNTHVLLNFVNTSYPSDGKTNLVLCSRWTHMEVIRNKTSKWYVSRKQFALNTFPAYCSGSAYLMSPDVTERLYKISFYVPFFWVDDYYITGELTRKLNIPLRNYKGHYLGDVYNLTEKYLISYTFFHIKLNEMFFIWNTVKYHNETQKVTTSIDNSGYASSGQLGNVDTGKTTLMDSEQKFRRACI